MGFHRVLSFLFAGLFSFVSAWAQDPPPGFTNPTILNDVLAGNINTQVVTNTATEQDVFLRAQFKKVSVEAYKDIATNYEGYPALLPEIQSASTTSVNATRTVFDYTMDVVFQEGFFPLHLDPTAEETYTAPVDAVSEGKLHNVITNYQDQFKLAEENVRLIPYVDSILVEDEVHVILPQAGSMASLVQGQLVNEFSRLLGAFRTKLNG